MSSFKENPVSSEKVTGKPVSKQTKASGKAGKRSKKKSGSWRSTGSSKKGGGKQEGASEHGKSDSESESSLSSDSSEAQGDIFSIRCSRKSRVKTNVGRAGSSASEKLLQQASSSVSGKKTIGTEQSNPSLAVGQLQAFIKSIVYATIDLSIIQVEKRLEADSEALSTPHLARHDREYRKRTQDDGGGTTMADSVVSAAISPAIAAAAHPGNSRKSHVDFAWGEESSSDWGAFGFTEEDGFMGDDKSGAPLRKGMGTRGETESSIASPNPWAKIPSTTCSDSSRLGGVWTASTLRPTSPTPITSSVADTSGLPSNSTRRPTPWTSAPVEARSHAPDAGSFMSLFGPAHFFTLPFQVNHHIFLKFMTLLFRHCIFHVAVSKLSVS